MPYEWTIDRTARMARVRGWGETDLEATLRATLEMASEPDFAPDFAVVVDLREIEFEATPDDVVAVGRHLAQIRELYRHRVAVVAPPALELPAELSAAIAGSGGVQIQVFSDLEQAAGWAGAEAERDSA